jgi:hypothetical protein
MKPALENIPCPYCDWPLLNEDVEITGGANHDGEDYFYAEITCDHCQLKLEASGLGQVYPQDGLITIAYHNNLIND